MSRRYYYWKIQENAPPPLRRSERSPRIPTPEYSSLEEIRIAAPLDLSEFPFRWDIARREQLGTLLEGDREEAYQGFRDDLIQAGARVLGAAGNARLVFVGRSPESLFDLMGGILRDSSWQGRVHLLPFSMHLNHGRDDLPTPTALAAYRDLLEAHGLLPRQIASSSLPITFADIVASGGSFYSLIALLKRFAQEDQTDWNAVRKKIRIVGICRQEKTSPKTWRWQQHSPWLTELMGGTHCVRNVSVRKELYHYLADYQPKTTPSYPPKSWGIPTEKTVAFRQKHFPSLRLARSLYEEGTSRRCRADFTAVLRE
ncbi:MAG: hypothetical protein EOO39_33700, partial [Cytophagaceae bacterium]